MSFLKKKKTIFKKFADRAFFANPRYSVFGLKYMSYATFTQNLMSLKGLGEWAYQVGIIFSLVRGRDTQTQTRAYFEYIHIDFKNS